MLILISGLGRFDYLASVEWDSLPFPFVGGLCVMVGALVKTGVIGDLARTVGNPAGRQMRCRRRRGALAVQWCGLKGQQHHSAVQVDPRRGRTLIVLVRGVIDDRVGVRVPTGAVLA